ncbi:catecholate siderophore receptor [Pacificibacter maritimus]|uniref:Catecholate siderophore receptor n=2 Tax=Pacificibacter maritimus TaxID=762213 RepID=A0A3N4U9C0_9RHOB|nr:catecholate siderophore receptor [Pacificibacter maritimus]
MRSLRNTTAVSRPIESRHIGLLGASLAAACFAGAATAQNANDGVIVLPTVDVETTEAAPAQSQPQRSTRRASAPRPAAPTVCTPELTGQPICAAEDAAREQAAREAAEAARVAEAKANAGNSPYADPNAGLKADTLSMGKLTGEIKDMPRTVTAVTKEALETTGTTSVRELARTTPGISLGFGEGGNAYGDNIYVRGFKANNDVYVDGVRDPGIGVRETFNTEQVEVLKGPAGTIGGRGTTGGAVNIATKKAQDVDFTHIGVNVTDAGTARTTLDMNRVVDDRFAYRLNGMLQDGDVAGRDSLNDDRQGASAAVRYKFNDKVTLEADYAYTNMNQTPDWGVPYISAPSGNTDPNFPEGPVTEFGVDRESFYGVKGRDYQEATSKVGTARLIWELDNGLTLTNTLRASTAINDYILTAPSSVNDNGSTDAADWTANLSFKSRYQETDVISDDLELSGVKNLGGYEHSFTFGAHISQEDVSTYSYDDLLSEDYQDTSGNRCVVDVVNPDAAGEGCWDGSQAQRSDSHTDTNVRTTSVFVMDSVKLSDQWTVNGGLRVDHYDLSRDSYDDTGAVTDSYSREDTMLNWNVGAAYKPQDDLTLYGAIATSTNPMGQEIASGGSFYGGLDENGQALAPEKNTSYELGVKYEYSDHLLLTAALFNTTKDNAREDIGGRGNSVAYDTLKYQVQGLELGVSGRIHDRIGVYGGAVYMDSEVLESQDPDAIGEEIPNIAKTQFNLLTTYDVTEDLMLGLQTNFVGERNLGGIYANGKTLPEQWSFDIVGSYQLNDNSDIQFGITNATDATLYDAAYRSGEPFTYVAPGREIWATFNVKF